MKLVIVESPAKSKTISKYLGREYAVRASVGHIRDLPKANKNAIDIAAGFVPYYEISKGKEKVISELRAAAKKADEVLLATDPDREGEAIAWHVAQALGLANPKRVVFYEITGDAVRNAIAHPRLIDQNLRRAQEARRVLDRLVGYDLSGLIWKKVRYGLSAGRVQSPALRILAEREREIRAFIAQDYWVITADTQTSEKDPLVLICSEEPKTEQEAEAILAFGRKNPWSVKEVSESATERRARPPFSTSTLQQAASSRLGFSPSRAMGIAQKLYEEGHITYMRTDSTALSATAQQQILNVVGKKYGKEYAAAQTYKTKSKNAQEAHEAIRPTDAALTSAGQTDEQQRLYHLIWQRTVASQMAPAQLLKTKITAQVGDGASVPDFFVNGSRTIFDGWLKADPHAKSEDIELPQVAVGETLTLLGIRSEHKQTQPPGRYSEAGLVKELEKRGIGRPSTYASIIKTLYERGYVEREGKSMRPTDTGEVVSAFLENNFAKYISDSFTAEMEDELDEIAGGTREYEKTLRDFYTPFSADVAAKKDTPKLTTLGDAPEHLKCPVCGADMVVKLGKSGKFLSCSRFPDCTGMRSLDGTQREGPRETGEQCPECKEGNLIEREGKYGKFIACSRYPKCKYIKKDENAQNKGEQTGIACPLCKTGVMVGRRGRFGIFYSCSNYPKCRYAIKAKPTGAVCPLCRSLMMEGTKTIPERCSNKECPNHNPHKTQ
ncbi:MAG: DNA topoisomerase I [Parcubacteria group bacterium Greene0714_36]|nr:MAG: DNA topoisomerase I [Parcubacteria group bacterium Greene0714_36]